MLNDFDTVAASEDGGWLHLENPKTGQLAYLRDKKGVEDESKPVRFHILGPDSPTLKTKVQKRMAEVLKRRGGAPNFKQMSVDQIQGLMGAGEGMMAENMADATTGWENFVGTDGKPLEFSRAKALEIYQTYPNILAQVQAFSENAGNFIKGA